MSKVNYRVEVRSKAGLLPRYHAIHKIDAESPEQALSLAITKTVKANPKFKNRNKPMFWQTRFL